MVGRFTWLPSKDLLSISSLQIRTSFLGPELSLGSATHKVPLIQNRWISANEHAVDEIGLVYFHAIVR